VGCCVGRFVRAGALLLLASVGLPVGAQAADDETRALVRVHATVPAEATTAATLGTEREGNGILIDSGGLILTIGYLIIEADHIDVETTEGTFPAEFVGYDGDTGFGLVRAPALRGAHPMPLGESAGIDVGDPLQVEGFGQDTQPVRVISRSEFVGSWEYLLENAIYAAPAYSDFGGAALVSDGKLVGVGSILATFSLSGVGRVACNMFVPVDILKPILQELVRSGRSGLPARPWLGVSTAETEGRVVVTMVTPGGPAERAGIRRGDVILTVERTPVAGIAEFYRRLWAAGSAGVSVKIRVLQGDSIRDVDVKSVDRRERLKPSPARANGSPASPTA